jgi:chromosome segregation ATPase
MTFDAATALTLAAEAEEDERNATPGPWGTRAERMRPRAIVIAGTEQVADCAEHTHWTDVQCERNAAAIVRMRNRNPQVASMLRAAVAELAEAHRKCETQGDEYVKLHALYTERLQALKTDRDSLRAKLAEVERVSAARLETIEAQRREIKQLEAELNNCECDCDDTDVKRIAAEHRASQAEAALGEMNGPIKLVIEQRNEALDRESALRQQLAAALQAKAALGEMTKERDWAVAVQRAALESQERLGTTLAAVLKAKEEACDIFARNFEGSIIEDDYKRITELRSVGKESK